MENKLATHRRSVLHYLRAVTALEDYTSITRFNFKLSVSLLPRPSNPLRVTPWFYNQSPVLWHDRCTVRRRGCHFSKSGLCFSFCLSILSRSAVLWSLLIDGFWSRMDLRLLTVIRSKHFLKRNRKVCSVSRK